MVTISRLAHGGAGVACHEGQALFVPDGLPGDRVRVRLRASRARRLEGRVVELLEPSPLRVAPPCAYAGVCGGCAWLALDVAAQRRARADLVRDALERIGRLEVPSEIPVVAVDSPGAAPGLGYRSRIEVALGPPAAGGRRAVGFRAHGSHDVVDIERCAVAQPAVNASFEVLRASAAAGRIPAAVAEIEIAAGDDPARVVATARLSRALSAKEAARLAGRLREVWPGLAGLRVEPPATARDAAAVERGDTRLLVSVPGPDGRPLVLEAPAGGFMQANPAVNARLVAAVLSALAPAPGMRLLDLYCGAGNFALPLAAAGALVTGIETDGRAVEAGRRSAARLGLGTARFRQVPVEEGLRWVGTSGAPRPGGAVLDPPRAGAGPVVVDRLLALAPARIAYVSCDPATLARDLARLAGGGYALAGLTVFDMFPQTPHVETLAVMEPREPREPGAPRP